MVKRLSRRLVAHPSHARVELKAAALDSASLEVDDVSLVAHDVPVGATDNRDFGSVAHLTPREGCQARHSVERESLPAVACNRVPFNQGLSQDGMVALVSGSSALDASVDVQVVSKADHGEVRARALHRCASLPLRSEHFSRSVLTSASQSGLEVRKQVQAPDRILPVSGLALSTGHDEGPRPCAALHDGRLVHVAWLRHGGQLAEHVADVALNSVLLHYVEA